MSIQTPLPWLIRWTGTSRRADSLRTTARDLGAFDGGDLGAPGAAVGEGVRRIAMPNMGGLELCRRLRKVSDVPIIVLSVRGEENTKVEALDAGADDYVTKPFGMDELLARIRAALRRQPAADAQAHILEAGDFRIDLDAHVLTRGGNEVHLTPKEFDLLAHLVRNAGKVLTHRALLGAVWGGDYTGQHEYLRVFIGQLRKKIEARSLKSSLHSYRTLGWLSI